MENRKGNSQDHDLLKQCIYYFKSTPGFERVFEKIADKYRSLGVPGGTVRLEGLTRAEKEALSGYLRKDYYSRKSASIKVESFSAALVGTRFEGVDFADVLQGYFNGTLVSKKDEKSLYEACRTEYFSSLIENLKGTGSAEWLKHALNSRTGACRLLYKMYQEDSSRLSGFLENTCKALDKLPVNEGRVLRLALFSQEISRNPHTFDAGTECGRLLDYGLSCFFGIPAPANTEARAELLYSAGIISDEVSNFVMCSGFRAQTASAQPLRWERESKRKAVKPKRTWTP
jgi:uncharacterized protein (TIGR02679 family)